MELSTRNQISGTVKQVTLGAVMAEVKVDVNGEEFVALVTKHSVEQLGVAVGDTVKVLIKATDVALGK